MLPDRASLEAAAARSFAAAAAFRAREPYRALELLFAEVAIERAISTLFSDSGWVGELIAPLITALAEDP